ncbi:MAG: response regulator [Alphaproteobacteria bacterium]
MCDEAMMTRPEPKVPREGRPQTGASDHSPGDAPRGVARSIRAAEAGSEQHVLAQAWLNEGGAVGDPEALNPLRILVVENDAMIATLIAETLEAMGHEICAIATTQAEAVAAAALYRPDLLLVDVHLQAGSGTGAVAEILLAGPVPHIFMTGDVLSGGGSESGAITLRKPFQDHHLAEAIRLAFAT